MTRRGAKLVIHVLGTLVGLATVLLAGAAWRLSQGPVSLDPLVPYLEAALNERPTGYRFQVGGAVLAWGDWQRAFDLTVLDLEVLHDDGTPAMAVGEVRLEMALPPLIRGELRPRSVMLLRPAISAVRHEDGEITLSVLPAADTQPTAPAESLTGGELVEAFLTARDLPPFDRLDSVAVVDAMLTVEDLVLGVVWRAPDATFRLDRRGDGLDAAASLALVAPGHNLDIELVAAYEPQARRIQVSARLNDFALDDLGALSPSLPKLAGLDVDVDGELTLTLDDTLYVEGGRFSLAAERGRIDLPNVFEAPFDLGPTRAEGRLGPGLSSVEITTADLGLGLERSVAYARIGGFTPQAEIEARLEVAGLAVDDLGRFWPVKLVPRARGWLTSHLSSGTVTSATLAFRATVAELGRNRMPLANLAIDVDVSGASITYIEGMPPVTDIDAVVAIADDRLRIEASTGRLNGLAGQRGLITMDGLNGRNGMTIAAEASGSIHDVLSILASGPLSLASAVGLPPDEVEGSIDGRVEIILPHLVGLKRQDVAVRVAADIADLALAGDLRGYRVSGGAGALVFDTASALFQGHVALDGVPFEIDVRQSFRPDDPVLRTVQLRSRLDDGERALLGLPDLIPMAGELGLVVDLAQAAEGERTWSAVAELADVALDYPLLGIVKPMGEAGRAAFRLVVDDGPVLRIESFDLDVGATEIRGAGALRSSDFGLMRLDFDRLAFGRNDLTGALSVEQDGLFDVGLAGGTADLEPLLEDLTASGGPTLPSFRLQGAVDRVWLTDNDSVEAVRIDGIHIADYWESLAVTGSLPGGTPTSLNIWRVDETERRFAYAAGDAGDAIRTVGLFDHAEGGSLEIRARIDDGDPDRPSTGVMRADDFILTESPILARILSVASLGGLANALSGDGLQFDSALVPFEKRGDLMTITDGRAFGPGLGITVFGTVDLGTDVLDLDGTIVPIYEINSALGGIPLIGDLLTGFEEGGGIFGFTYEVTGPRDEPEVAVDPLSLMTPGILRRLFSAPSDDEIESYSFEGARPGER